MTAYIIIALTCRPTIQTHQHRPVVYCSDRELTLYRNSPAYHFTDTLIKADLIPHAEPMNIPYVEFNLFCVFLEKNQKH